MLWAGYAGLTLQQCRRPRQAILQLGPRPTGPVRAAPILDEDLPCTLALNLPRYADYTLAQVEALLGVPESCYYLGPVHVEGRSHNSHVLVLDSCETVTVAYHAAVQHGLANPPGRLAVNYLQMEEEVLVNQRCEELWGAGWPVYPVTSSQNIKKQVRVHWWLWDEIGGEWYQMIGWLSPQHLRKPLSWLMACPAGRAPPGFPGRMSPTTKELVPSESHPPSVQECYCRLQALKPAGRPRPVPEERPVTLMSALHHFSPTRLAQHIMSDFFQKRVPHQQAADYVYQLDTYLQVGVGCRAGSWTRCKYGAAPIWLHTF